METCWKGDVFYPIKSVAPLFGYLAFPVSPAPWEWMVSQSKIYGYLPVGYLLPETLHPFYTTAVVH